jgi:hypothetical protein
MTAQIHEELIFDGEECSMAFCPPLPEHHPRIVEVDPFEAPRDRLEGFLYSTACWRRYQGTWEIRDGRFSLTRLRGRFKLLGEGPLFADWFSGVLRITRGEILQYVHMGFGSVYEQEVHLKVENGVVTATKLIDNRGKDFDGWQLGWQNLPGSENRFPGDDGI